jgi:hypothetical protein
MFLTKPKRRLSGRSEKMMTHKRENDLRDLAGLPPRPALALALAAGENDDTSPQAKQKRELRVKYGLTPNRGDMEPQVKEVFERAIARTSHPATNQNYRDAERDLRAAFTNKQSTYSTGILDRPAFMGALKNYCTKVGYPMPAGAGND